MEDKFTFGQLDRIIEMAWEDHTTFDAIEYQFGILEGEVIEIMRRELAPPSFKRWRRRVQGRKTRHAQLRTNTTGRFKSWRQKTISGNKISKRT